MLFLSGQSKGKGCSQYSTETMHFVVEFPCFGVRKERRRSSLTAHISLQTPVSFRLQQVYKGCTEPRRSTCQNYAMRSPCQRRQFLNSASSREANSCLYTPRTNVLHMSVLPPETQRGLHSHGAKDSPRQGRATAKARATSRTESRGASVFSESGST